MSEPRWLTSEVRVAHERQLVRFGGPAGLRDENALGSALALPINRWRYEEADLARWPQPTPSVSLETTPLWAETSGSPSWR